MSVPLVSVVVVSWNTRDLLRQCLRSVECASRGVDGAVQIVVVDNASSDGTVDVLTKEFPGVTVVANVSNRGFAAATNQGIKASAGRYIALLNPDTDLEESALDQLLRFLETCPKAGAAGPRLIHEDGALQASCFRLPTVAREFWRLFHLNRILRIGVYRMDGWSLHEPRRVEALQGACLVVRRDTLSRIGPLDERFFMYTEEIDLCHRMRSDGWDLYWVPASVVVHYGGQSSRQAATRMFLELYRSKIEYFRKHSGHLGCWLYKAVLFVAILPRVLAPSAVAVITPAHRTELRAIGRNYRALLAALPSL